MEQQIFLWNELLKMEYTFFKEENWPNSNFGTFLLHEYLFKGELKCIEFNDYNIYWRKKVNGFSNSALCCFFFWKDCVHGKTLFLMKKNARWELEIWGSTWHGLSLCERVPTTLVINAWWFLVRGSRAQTLNVVDREPAFSLHNFEWGQVLALSPCRRMGGFYYYFPA